MAIAFDAAANGSASPGTSITFSHTCTGSDLILLVFVGQGGTNADSVTGITYNSVSMTRALFQAGSTTAIWAYYLINPSTGANNVVVSSSGSVFFRASSVSYTGAKQSSQPDATDGDAVASGTSTTTTLTTVADNCWTVCGVESNGAGSTPAASTGINATRDTIGTLFVVGDSDGGITPAGSNSMTWTSTSQELTSIQVSIAPSVTVTPNKRLTLLGIG